MSSVKEESKPVVSKAGKKRVHRRQRAKEQGTADSDRSNDEDESARETAAGKKRRQNPMLQTYITKNRHSEDAVKTLKNIRPIYLGRNKACECKGAINCCASALSSRDSM
ncbi:unnamed protein product, partial [Mesorhabditis belari]|uniref:Uncharacterized protein n=1 Tax=Mesorhabditis belari TaxID=2138241 RepID=A0AAF3J8H7_9BILA